MVNRQRWCAFSRFVLVALILGWAGLLPLAGFAEDLPTPYRLGTGDKIRLTVYNEATLSGEFSLNDQGAVTLPLIGPVVLIGKTIAESEAMITERYGKDYLVNPRVNVEVLSYRPFFILGEVRSPGSYAYVNGMTVVNAVALAGGYTPRSNRDRIVVKRASDPDKGEQRVEEDSAVLPGDVIRVPERFF